MLTDRIETKIANMKAAKSANQLILVSASGTRATVIMYQKNSNGTWKKLLSASGYVGASGVGQAHEGKSITPEGAYHILKAFGIKNNPGCPIGYTKVDSTHYYVAHPTSPYYNKLVSTRTVTNFKHSYGEQIIRYSPAYNHILDFDYNPNGTPYAGSCFFLHCSTGKAIGGCISVPETAMVQILKKIQKNCMIVIANGNKVYNY